MTFDEWWEKFGPLGASPARRKDVAKAAWEDATAAERERCAEVAESLRCVIPEPEGRPCDSKYAQDWVNEWVGRIAAFIRSGGEGGRG